ncbi:MAG: hypothetical protein SFZ03_07935 [Candidatus Melainabacteria bacterium]|nr:hypothetical protein [Candidatus Melainabacteria bacterium]
MVETTIQLLPGSVRSARFGRLLCGCACYALWANLYAMTELGAGGILALICLDRAQRQNQEDPGQRPRFS